MSNELPSKGHYSEMAKFGYLPELQGMCISEAQRRGDLHASGVLFLDFEEVFELNVDWVIINGETKIFKNSQIVERLALLQKGHPLIEILTRKKYPQICFGRDEKLVAGVFTRQGIMNCNFTNGIYTSPGFNAEEFFKGRNINKLLHAAE